MTASFDGELHSCIQGQPPPPIPHPRTDLGMSTGECGVKGSTAWAMFGVKASLL